MIWQLKLLMWKNFLIRRRQPGVFHLVYIWPVMVFLLLYTVRQNVKHENNPTCQYPARLMPHDGLLPFIQNYICSIGNSCGPLDEYQELPIIKNSTLAPLMIEFQSAMMNQTVLTAVKAMPKSIQLLKSMAEILTKPEIKKLFDGGIRLGDLFNNHEAIKSLLRSHLPEFDENYIDDLLNASIKLYYLIETFGSSNLDGIICSPESLKKYLILDNDEDLVEISRVLCNLDSNKISVILEHLTSNLDFAGLLGKVTLAKAKFQEYSFIDDLVTSINTVLDLKTVKKYLPPELKLREWLPKMVVLFRNVSLREMDLSLINRIIDQLEPIFLSHRDWSVVRDSLENFKSLIEMTNDLVVKKRKSQGTSVSIYEMGKSMTDLMRNISLPPQDFYDVAKILDVAYVILRDFGKLTNSILNEYADELTIATEVLDGLMDHFSNYIMNVLTYVISMGKNIVDTTHHVAIIREEINEKLYNVSLNNFATVKKILTTVDPEVYRTVTQSMSRLDFVERLVDDLTNEKLEVLLCQEDILSEIFQGYKDFNGTSSIVRELFCSESGKVFIADFYAAFEFDNYQKNIEDTLSTFISMSFGLPIPIEKSNLTSLVTSVRNLVIYLDNIPAEQPDWSVFQTTEKWEKVYRDNQIQVLNNVLGVHLSMAKTLGLENPSYRTIVPDLVRMDMIADMILRILRNDGENWIVKFRQHVHELVESFYMTVADRQKVLKFLEYANFSRSYCIDDESPKLVNYPSRSNATLLKNLVCHLATTVDKILQFNITKFHAESKANDEIGVFNWTSFNVKILKIYRYIETILQENDVDYDDERLNQLKRNFMQAWTKDINLRDGLEFSVGIISKLFHITESPLFNVNSQKQWEQINSLARAIWVIADTIDHAIDRIHQSNHTIEVMEINRYLPKTERLLYIFLRNFESFILDFFELINSPIKYGTLIKNYMSVEINWPCVKNQSLGHTLQLGDGSREIIHEFETIACNIGEVTKEWKEHEVFNALRRVFDVNNNDTIIPKDRVNWTLLYQRFRLLVDKIDSISDKWNNFGVISLKRMQKIVEETIGNIDEGPKSFFEHVDAVIENGIVALKSDKSAADSWTWTRKKRSFDDILILSKFATRVLHDITRFLVDAISTNSNTINLINLMGFTNKTIVSLTYDKAPYIVAMIINVMSDVNLEDRAFNEILNRVEPITCSEIFSWFYNYKIGITIEEYTILKNSSCDGDPDNFNVFLDLYKSWEILWYQPVSQYHGYYTTLIFTEILQLYNRSLQMASKGMIVELPFSEKYFDLFLKTLTNALTIEDSTIILNRYVDTRWWKYRLGIEGLSEILDHAVVAMNNMRIEDDEIHTWDLVDSGDVRQLLKILESQAIETIALSATLATYNTANNSIVSFKDLHHLMCKEHFQSNYWNTENRTKFLDRVCNFDAHQLLRRATSDGYYEAVVNDSPHLQRNAPLSKSLTKFIVTLTNKRTSSGKKMRLVSNIFNATAWFTMPEETRELVRLTEKSWAHKLATIYNEKNGETALHHAIPKKLVYMIIQLDEAVAFLLDILDGGDIWTRWKLSLENPTVRLIFTLIEDAPNFFITFIDTFVNSERLSDFVKSFIVGRVDVCDIEKYLIQPVYVRRNGYFTGIGKFCENFIIKNKTINIEDLLPTQLYMKKLDIASSRILKKKDNLHRLNETMIFRDIEKIETTFVRLLKHGPKPVKVPAWWLSFETGNWMSFKKQYASKDVRTMTHMIIKKIATLIKDTRRIFFGEEDCSWCNGYILQILNTQLSRHQVYSNIMCNINLLSYSRIEESVARELNWNETIDMIKVYGYQNREMNFDDFLTSVSESVEHIVDIIIDYKIPKNDKNLTECFFKAVGVTKNYGIKFYVKLLLGIIDTLERYIHVFETSSTNEKILSLTRMADKFVPIWRPLSEVVEKSEIEKIMKILPNASIDVNYLYSQNKNSSCIKRKDCNKQTIFEDFFTTKSAKKWLRYDEKAAKYSSIATIANLFSESIDFNVIDDKIVKWRREASANVVWLREILKHLAVVIEEGGNLLDVANKIDFNDVSKFLGISDTADGVINLLKDRTIDKLFEALKDIVDDIEPFIAEYEVKHDMRAIVETFESMTIFKNLGLFDIKSVISQLFIDWNKLQRFLVDEIKISVDLAKKISVAKIDMISIFMKERRAISFRDTVCSTENIEEILSLESGETSAKRISSALCGLDDTATQNITIELIKNLNFEYIFTNLMSANVKNILNNANLTEIEGQEVFDSIGVVAELMPLFKDKLPSAFSIDQSPNNMEGSTDMLSSGQFLQDASTLMCGKELFSNGGMVYNVIGNIEDKTKFYDQDELNSLPTDFCREIYKTVISTSSGKIIWSHVKPLIRGKILYAPSTLTVDRIMSYANETFRQIETFGDVMKYFDKTLRSLASLSEMGQSLNDLNDIMSSKVMRIAIKSMSGGSVEGDFSNFDVADIAWKVAKSSRLKDMVGMLNDFMKCVLADRIRGFSNEEEMENEARHLADKNTFLAGIVFLNQDRNVLSLNDEFPNDVIYKIRMDLDSVPSTKRLKTQFWLPGPEAVFIEDLRYQRGFIQMQDAIDRAIMREKLGEIQNWKTVTQQMPYPCWEDTSFMKTLYESQGVQICFFFALMMCAGSAVRYLVWDQESNNSMVMSVMGLKPHCNTFAWFITTYIELTIVMMSILAVLYFGSILPRSDPIILMIFLQDYAFSIVTFCYMVSTMFSSASLAAVTTVVLFLLTYMPYVIVIAMDASMGFVWKIIMCSSMSTSFQYGCLYILRREVQGTGMRWDMVWEEASPGDTLSLGFVLIMIALDGIIYGLIGCVISRSQNSDVGNDTGSIIVTEKQSGIRFESVKKEFTTTKNKIPAVDDFTLNLNEGEVTSLLGRNGAGKTTIIKMLTGMMAATEGKIFLPGADGTKPDIGVCPQDNVLIDYLTPHEHMTFYARLRYPTDTEAVEKNVNSMLASLELGKQEHEQVCRLSGGTKRRLCVALAFLGSPKLVILDEPGAGVDPAARRRIWHLIDQHRANTTILLSTHHLDEADMLSDKVVIMNKGKILRTGSPLTLKSTCGHGYVLNVEFPISNSQETMIDRKIFEQIRSLLIDAVPNATIDKALERELIMNLPFRRKNGEPNDIALAVRILEENQESLGFNNFTLDCDTLNGIFLDLCVQAEKVDPPLSSGSSDSITSGGTLSAASRDDVNLVIGESRPNPKILIQARALLKKRLWHFMGYWTSPLATLLLPTMFVAVSMGFSLIRPPSGNEPALDLNSKLYDVHPTYFYSIDDRNDPFLRHVSLQLQDLFGGEGVWQTHSKDTGTCECKAGQQVCHVISKAVDGLHKTLPGRPTLDWIISTFDEYIERRYGGWSLSHADDDPLFIVWYNNKGHHSMPAYLNALNQAILQAAGIPGKITTLNHPLRLSRDQINRTSLIQHVADLGVALVLLVAFSLVAALGAKELVRERISEEKRIIFLAGVHPVTYWITALVWDLLVFSASIVLAVIVFEIFGIPTYVARDNLSGVCLLLILFAWAAVPFTHLAEKIFHDSSVSNMVLFCVNTWIGVACLATILVMDILSTSQTAKDIRQVLHYGLLLFPQYAFADALVEITKNDITAELLENFHIDTYKSPISWELLGLHYTILFFVGFILCGSNLIWECGCYPDCPRSRPKWDGIKEDEDVVRERTRVDTDDNNDVMKTIRLRKEFGRICRKEKVVAVQNLSFGVVAGECFGILGVNGAGKSTTFRMFTTDLCRTSGEIFLHGKRFGRKPLCNGEVGYCPQYDSVDGLLTPHQCLTIHGEICGLDDISRVVDSSLNCFGLMEYAHQRVNSLSGGNRRKLCVAISVMSPVSLVLMDEPMSGMDPASKELVRTAVGLVTKNQGSVIMTSHNVAECEKFCNRVGVLGKHGLCCIGTVPHLKRRFGEGNVIFMRFSMPITPKDLRQTLARYFPTAVISSRQAMAARLLVPRSKKLTLSHIFTQVNHLAGEIKAQDYTVTPSSLDQVLVNFSEVSEDDLIEDHNDKMYGSIANRFNQDSIRMETFDN